MQAFETESLETGLPQCQIDGAAGADCITAAYTLI